MFQIKYLVIFGDLVFIAWMTFNGIDEGFKATPMQAFSYVGLTVLLILNIYLLLRKKQ